MSYFTLLTELYKPALFLALPTPAMLHTGRTNHGRTQSVLRTNGMPFEATVLEVEAEDA